MGLRLQNYYLPLLKNFLFYLINLEPRYEISVPNPDTSLMSKKKILLLNNLLLLDVVVVVVGVEDEEAILWILFLLLFNNRLNYCNK
jgi:hypothetical protein